MSAVPEDRRPIWEQMDDVSRQIREARYDAAREQLAAAYAMLRTVCVEAQGAPPGWVMMKSWVIREVEALLASADPGTAPVPGELVVSECAYEQIASERNRPGEAIPALVDLFENSKNDLMSDTAETGPDELVDRVAKVFTAATFWLIKDDAMVREIVEAFRAGARMAITEVRAHDQPIAIETAAEPRCARFGGKPTCPEAEEFYCRVHCYHEQPDTPVAGTGDPAPEDDWMGEVFADAARRSDRLPPDVQVAVLKSGTAATVLPGLCETCGGSGDDVEGCDMFYGQVVERRVGCPDCGGSGRTDRQEDDRA